MFCPMRCGYVCAPLITEELARDILRRLRRAFMSRRIRLMRRMAEGCKASAFQIGLCLDAMAVEGLFGVYV